MLGLLDVMPGNDVIANDFLVVIDIMQEQIQRSDALDEAGLDVAPLRGGNNPGDEIEWEDAFGSLVVAVNGESDALVEEGKVGHLPAFLELLVGQLVEAIEQLA